MRVLVIDDNVDAAVTLAAFMKAAGHEVWVSYDGPSGLRRAREWEPGVVLLDIGLPRMDGYEVAREIRAMALTLQPLLVAVSGYDDPVMRARSSRAGIDLHFSKSADVRAILEAMALWRAPVSREQSSSRGDSRDA